VVASARQGPGSESLVVAHLSQAARRHGKQGVAPLVVSGLQLPLPLHATLTIISHQCRAAA